MRWPICVVALVCAVWSAVGARAEDPVLVGLHAALVPLRVPLAADGRQAWREADDDLVRRNAVPAFGTLKKILREWIESRLSRLEWADDETVLTVRLNEELRDADLLCTTPTDRSGRRCDADATSWSHIGFVEPVRVEYQRLGRVLVVYTGLGILCGSDDSAYAYEFRDGKWRRFWQYEQDAAAQPYQPRFIDAVQVSYRDDKSHDRFVLALGYVAWCASNLYPVTYALWRANPDLPQPKLLLDEIPEAFHADLPPIRGRVDEKGDVLIEYTQLSFDPGIHSFQAVRHYRVNNDVPTRIAPFALRPRSFVEEWLKGEWSQSATWSAEASRPALKRWYDRLSADGEHLLYGEDTAACRNDRTLWQVSLLHGKDADDPDMPVYFILRWQPPYRFEMVEVRSKPRSDCDRADSAADARQTLFEH